MGWTIRALTATAYAQAAVVAGMAVGANDLASGYPRRDFYALGMQEARGNPAPEIVNQVAFTVGDFGYGLGYWMAERLGVLSVTVTGYVSCLTMLAVTGWLLISVIRR